MPPVPGFLDEDIPVHGKYGWGIVPHLPLAFTEDAKSTDGEVWGRS